MKSKVRNIFLICLIMMSLLAVAVPVKAEGYIVIDVLCAGDEEFMADPDNAGQAEAAIQQANSFTSIWVTDCFETTFGIHFAVRGWKTWDSDDNVHDPTQMAYEVWTETGFEDGMGYNGYIIDMLCAFTGQDIEGYYAVTFPDANITLIEEWVASNHGVIRHEFSHQFDCPECTNICVMNYACVFHLPPHLDWCGDCKDWINAHKHKWPADYQLSISAGSGGTTDPPPGSYVYREGTSVTVTASAYSYYTFDYWVLGGETVHNNPITVTMNSDHTLKAYFRHVGDDGGGGGCPYVSTWNNTEYVLDNNLLPASEASDGIDVVDYYKLQQPLVLDDGLYRLLLSEFENEHDFFDQVKLLAVDHQPNVDVAVSPYGEILAYAEPSPPVSAIDNNNRNVKHILGEIDGDYYEGYNGSYITLNFGDELDVSNGAKLVMSADLEREKWSIHIQVKDEDDNWNTVATVIPRVYWATEIIDLSEYLPDAKGNLKVRLYFTDNHKLDFVGLDTSPQATINIHEGQLISAIHSTNGEVTTKLLYSDETYAELVPEQQIILTFTLPPQTTETRNYIIITEGHYYTIQT